MKNLTLIVRADARARLADRLRALPQVPGFSFTHVEGHGTQRSDDPSLSARDLVVGYTPRVRIDILLADHDVEVVLEALRETGCGSEGRCVYWVTAVERHGRL